MHDADGRPRAVEAEDFLQRGQEERAFCLDVRDVERDGVGGDFAEGVELGAAFGEDRGVRDEVPEDLECGGDRVH